MRHVFADTSFFVAQLYVNDTHHERATAVSQSLGEAKIVTLEMVLAELLNFFAARPSPAFRKMAADLVDRLRSLTNVQIEPQTSDLFRSAHKLYKQREDHTWSLTDCASFCIMTRLAITDALTHDRHFQQAGFRALMVEGQVTS